MRQNPRTRQEKRRRIAVEPEVEGVAVAHEDVAALGVVVGEVAEEAFDPA